MGAANQSPLPSDWMLRMQAETYASQILERIPIGVGSLCEDLCIRRANPALCRLFQLQPTQLLGYERLGAVICGLDVERMARQVRATREEETAFDVRVVQGDIVRYVTVSLALAAPESVDPYLVFVTETTDRHQLAERAEHFIAVVEASEDAIFLVDGDNGKLVELNESTTRITGYSRSELLSMSVSDLSSPSERTTREVAHGSPMQGGVDAERSCAAIRRRDGSPMTVEMTLRSLTLGGRRRVVGFMRDMSERARSESALSELNANLEELVRVRTAELERSNTDLERFSYSVAHDLRSPLRSMHGFASLLLEKNSPHIDPEGLRMLMRIRASADRMGALIEGLLEYARVARNDLQMTEIDLSAIASWIVNDLVQAESQRRVKIYIEKGMHIKADPAAMHSVLLNLLGNAWKYTARSPTPEIRFCRDANGEEGAFQISDNGIGFDMSHALRLFRPFERMHRADEYEGVGIGLATVQRIIERHGGEVRAESAIGRGTTIHFKLAVARN